MDLKNLNELGDNLATAPYNQALKEYNEAAGKLKTETDQGQIPVLQQQVKDKAEKFMGFIFLRKKDTNLVYLIVFWGDFDLLIIGQILLLLETEWQEKLFQGLAQVELCATKNFGDYNVSTTDRTIEI